MAASVSPPIALVVHGHFYQPPRENPWSDELETEPSAAPFHDWNARIHAECYRANAWARIRDGAGQIASIRNNYARLSFNFGPTLARWLRHHDSRAHARLQAADADQRARLGTGGAMAQAYAHPILPLCSPADRRTQILWGLSDFKRRFGRDAQGFWLPETAADSATLAALIDLGVSYTILAPEQVSAVRAPGEAWTKVDRDTVDTGRPYRWLHPDGSGRFLSIGIFDGPLSRQIAFGEITRDAGAFVAAIAASAKRSAVSPVPLVLCASDGELFGHHKKFADMNLAFTTFVEAPRHGIQPTNLGAHLQAYPARWEMKLYEGPDGKGSAWSCNHGVGRWWRDCGCASVPPERGWNQRWRGPLRQALDRMAAAAGDFFEDVGAELLVDPWGVRDAYGEVVDEPVSTRDAFLLEHGTAALGAGGAAALERARLLLEMQRATLLMVASCGFFFDDIAGLEAALDLRLCAYAADLMAQAGGQPPLDELLDLLAAAKSNEAAGETGADVFNRVAADRITPARATAVVGLGRLGTSDPVVVESLMPGNAVEIVDERVGDAGGRATLTGRAHVTARRTGVAATVAYQVGWDPARGFKCVVDGKPIELDALGREDRFRLLPLLLPRLVHDSEPVMAARLALRLARGLFEGVSADGPSVTAVRGAFGDLLVRWLAEGGPAQLGSVEIALSLLDAAGPALGPGTLSRSVVEELVADAMERGAPDLRAALTPLAARLGFSPRE